MRIQAQRLIADHKAGASYKNSEKLVIRTACVELGLMSDGAPLKWKPKRSLRHANKTLKIHRSSLMKILKKPLAEYAAEHHNQVRKSVSKFPVLDERMYTWFMKQRAGVIPINNQMLTEQARMFARDLGIPATSFTAGNSWLYAWRIRWNISKSMKAHGKAGQVDVNDPVINKKVRAIRDEIERLQILPEDVFNTDETGLFFRATPQRTMVSLRDIKTVDVRGAKLEAKDRVTLLLAVNSTGSCKIPITVIGLAKNPRCFGKDGKKCPCFYMDQSSSWCDGPRFKEWLIQVFAKHVRARHTRPVMLIMDNCGGHTAKELEFTKLFNVHVALLPPNTTSVLQPLDAGIIAMVKARYRVTLIRRTLEFRNKPAAEQAALEAVAKTKRQGTCGLDYGSKAHVLDAIRMAKDAWASVEVSAIQNCWRKTGLLEGKPGGRGASEQSTMQGGGMDVGACGTAGAGMDADDDDHAPVTAQAEPCLDSTPAAGAGSGADSGSHSPAGSRSDSGSRPGPHSGAQPGCQQTVGKRYSADVAISDTLGAMNEARREGEPAMNEADFRQWLNLEDMPAVQQHVKERKIRELSRSAAAAGDRASDSDDDHDSDVEEVKVPMTMANARHNLRAMVAQLTSCVGLCESFLCANTELTAAALQDMTWGRDLAALQADVEASCRTAGALHVRLEALSQKHCRQPTITGMLGRPGADASS